MRTAAGGLVAITLLFLYAYLIWVGCSTVDCANTSGCTAYRVPDFNGVMAQAMSVIGGLVSSLIIAVLAVTKRGSMPIHHVLPVNAKPWKKGLLNTVTGLYLLGWIGFGLYAFLVGMHHPDTLPVLTSVGQSWLGLAVPSAYAYFGLQPANVAKAK